LTIGLIIALTIVSDVPTNAPFGCMSERKFGSRNWGLVMNISTSFELQTYLQYLNTLANSLVPILRLFGGEEVKFCHLSNPKKALYLRERRIMTYCARGCVRKCDGWAWWRRENRI